MITKDELEKLKEKYPVGCTVKLTKMDDPQAPAIGTKGFVKGVDDIGSLLVEWQNGSSLNVVYGEDECVRVRVCPKCKEYYSDVPATSRKDKKEICPRCGVIESLESVNMPQDKIDEILKKVDAINK